MTISDPKLAFGFGIPLKEFPTLPEGWGVLFRSDNFAFLISPQGKRYWLHWKDGRIWGFRAKKATLWDFIRTWGKLKWGKDFMDDRERVDPMLDWTSKLIEISCRNDLSNQMRLAKKQ